MSAQIVLILMFVTAFTEADGQVIEPGTCEDTPTKENFQLDQYVGTWYDIEKFYFAGMMDDRCVKAEYTARPDGTLGVVNSGITLANRVKNITGRAYYKDSNVKSRLTVQLAGSPEGNYWVIDTDYVTYSIVWSCRNMPLDQHMMYAWILGRTRTLDPAVVAAVKQTMENLGIDTSHFTATNQENCENWESDSFNPSSSTSGEKLKLQTYLNLLVMYVCIYSAVA